MTGFQTRVNSFQPPAVEGDFASANERMNPLTIPGGFVTGPLGVTLARFAWVAADGKTVNNFASSAVKPDGYASRQANFGSALITTYLTETSNLVPRGFMITLHDEGDFWILNRTGGAVAKGTQIYASYADGTPLIGAAPTGASATGSIGATFTGAGSGTTLTASSVTGYISPGDTISGTGVPAGTTVVSQLTGTAGGAGTYQTSVATTASGTVTSFGSVLSVSAVANGTLAQGDAITGTGVPAGAALGSQISGTTGGVGLYNISTPASAYAASTAITVATGILTNFVTGTAIAAGALGKMTTWGQAVSPQP